MRSGMYGSGMGTNRPTFEENTVAEIRRLIEAEPGLSRTALSRRLGERCSEFSKDISP